MQMLSLAREHRNADALIEGLFIAGYASFFRGDLAAALHHLEQGITQYGNDARNDLALQYGHDPGMSCRFFAACALWLLGYPDQSRLKALEAVNLAQKIKHPFTLAYAHGTAALALQLGRHVTHVRDQAQAGINVSREQGFPQFLGFAEAMLGWVLIEDGQAEEGLKRLARGAQGWRSQGSELWRPYWLALLTEAHTKAGRMSTAAAALDEAMDIAHRTEERFYLAELYRLRGEVSLLTSTEARFIEAETCFQNAVEVARAQRAKSLELRATTSLARLLESQGRCDEARTMLAEIYGWFTEGFDTADLKDAKELLEELAG